MQAEYGALISNNTRPLVKLPLLRTPIGCKWLFRIKESPDGSLNKYKARLVAKGFHQKSRFDFHETFSPVIKLVSVRILLTNALSLGWAIKLVAVRIVLTTWF